MYEPITKHEIKGDGKRTRWQLPTTRQIVGLKDADGMTLALTRWRRKKQTIVIDKPPLKKGEVVTIYYLEG